MPTSSLLKDFVRVSPSFPCPVCQRDDWCLVAVSGDKVICSREESSVKWGNAGHVHDIQIEPLPTPQQEYKPVSPEKLRRFHFESILRITEEDKEKLSLKLGLPKKSLDAMGVGICDRGFTFPMYDSVGNIIGVRIRSEDKKFAKRGSRNGLFLPEFLEVDTRRLIVVEGASDAAAALALGFSPVGRPSCSGLHDMVAEYLSQFPGYKCPVIVADNDQPGIEGARKLAKSLGYKKSYVIYPKRAKDLRSYYNHDGGPGMLLMAVHGRENADWYVEEITNT